MGALELPIVCGIDCSTLERPNWVAWLTDSQFILDSYIPTDTSPLPSLTFMPVEVACFALDAPQGLPALGADVRKADKDANTPTRRLPYDRGELAKWKAYRGLIEAGVEIFWRAYEGGLADIPGLLGPTNATPAVIETYPRYMIRRMWPDLRIPSKRSAPLEYVDSVYSRIQKLGYVCRSVIRPTVDQVDAMVCALAAERFAGGPDLPAGTVGAPPVADEKGRVLREGYIVSA